MPFYDPSTSFWGRQAIRDQYQAAANALRELAPKLPVSFQSVVSLHLAEVSRVIARGATLTDLKSLKAKVAEWERLSLEQVAAELAATERVAAQYAAEAAAERERVERVAARRRAIEQAAAAAAAGVSYEAPTTLYEAPTALYEAPPVAAPLMAGLMDNPVLIAVAVGAIIFLLKK